MKVDDSILGALFALLGVVVLWHVQGFPVIPGQKFGAALFPGVVSAGLVVCGVLLAVRGLRRHVPGGRLLAFDDWARDPLIVMRFLSVPAGLLFYVLTSNYLGFHIAASLAMMAWLLVFGMKPLPALAIAIAFPAIMHLAFYKILRVPLPWGLLTNVVFPVTADVLAQAFTLVFDPYVLWVVAASAAFGLFVGAVPGLTATMATALLVPATFFMPPIPAIASMVTATAMAIFAGDIPSCLLRIPGTPASAAYTDEAYALTRKGQGELSLGCGLVFSVIGGLFGTVVLILAAPILAEFALRFSSFEYFWLTLLGLSCAVFIATGDKLKGMISLLIGLLVATVGLDNPAAFPRFTFGLPELMGGAELIPIMVGMFAVSEVMRSTITVAAPLETAQTAIGNVFRGMWGLFKKYPLQTLRGSLLGTLIGALPGAGADIAAWMSYAMSKKFSKEPEKFGTGHLEGIVESGAANNSALAGAWIPAMVFGIPGDSITAIVIGVLYMKNLNPGPTLFVDNAPAVYAVFLLFILANLLMLPFGWAAIKSFKQILRMPRKALLPCILVFCILGAFAINNSVIGIAMMLAFGVLAWFLEENGIPVAPAILGMVLGTLLEEHFVTSMIKSEGRISAFFDRPIAGTLGVMMILLIVAPPLLRLLNRRRVSHGA